MGSAQNVRTPLMILAALAMGGSALGQCNLYRFGVPDFDQRRSGLPEGGGNVHCVPTSATNWMAYIANHGYPNLMLGARNWQAQSNHQFVTDRVEFMGDLMNTQLPGGTNGAAGEAGLQVYLMAHGFGLFTATRWHGGVGPFDMFIQMSSNGLVNICYGFYDELPGVGGNFYDRDGGHCVTLVGLQDVCTSTPRVQYRDPSSDDGDTLGQSTFSTSSSETTVQTFYTDPLRTQTATRWRMLDLGVGSTTRRYIDSMYVIRANFSCWAPPATGIISVQKAALLIGDPQPQTVNIPAISGHAIKALALHPTLGKAVYVSEVPSAAGNGNRVYMVDLSDGTQMQMLALPGGRTSVEFNRFGKLYITDGSSIKCYDVNGPTPTLDHSLLLPAAPSGISFDDANNEIIAVTPSNRRLIRLRHDLTSVADEPLPTGVPAMGDGSVVPDPTLPGKYLLNIVGSPSVHQLSLIPGSPRLQLDNSLLLPAVQSVHALKIADGVVHALCDGSVKTLDRDPLANRLRVAPSQPFAGLGPVGTMSMSMSRTNFDPRLHTGPAYNEVIEPTPLAGVPDCAADFDANLVVNPQDIFAFLNAWFTLSMTADFDGSNTLQPADIFEFLNAWFAGC